MNFLAFTLGLVIYMVLIIFVGAKSYRAGINTGVKEAGEFSATFLDYMKVLGYFKKSKDPFNLMTKIHDEHISLKDIKEIIKIKKKNNM